MEHQTQRARGWCFTSFESDTPSLPKSAQYLVAQHEICPETQRMHWQGFVYFRNPQRFNTLKKLFPQAHIEQMKGSIDQAIAYCQKTDTSIKGTQIEIGERPEQGRRSDIHDVLDAMRDGQSLQDVMLDYPEVCSKYLRYIKEVQLLMNRPSVYMPRRCLLISGPPGCGKTGIVHDGFGYDQVYTWNWSQKWFDGYSQQRCILLDEFCHHSVDPNFLKQLCDGYPITRETKGGHVRITSDCIVLCTNEYPETLSLWFELTPGIKRRITWWNFHEDAPNELCPPGHPYFEKNLEKIKKYFANKNGFSEASCSKDS